MDKHHKVIEYIAQEFEVDANFYNNKKRLKTYARPRKMLCWTLYNIGGLSMNEVASIVGYAEHTTVLYHIHDYWYMCRSDDDFQEKGFRIIDKANEIYEKG